MCRFKLVIPLFLYSAIGSSAPVQLPDITITGTSEESPMEEPVAIGSHIPIAPLDMPRNVQAFTDKDIQNRGSESINELVQKNVSGISINADPEAPNRSNFMIRGFQIDDDWGTKIDGQSHLEWTDLDFYNVQRVEVQKGPGAANNGIGDPGGFVNYVTKKADWTNNGEVNQTIDTKGSHITNLQQNYAITDQLAGRTVVTYQDGPVPQINGRNDNENLWLSQNFMAKLNNVTTFEFDVRHVEHNQNYGAASFLPVVGTNPLALPLRTNLSSPDDNIELKDTEVAYKLDTQFSKDVAFHHDAKYQDSERKYHYLMPFALDGDMLETSFYDYNNHKVNIGTDNYFTFKKDVFGFKNTLVTGAQFYRWHTKTASNSTYPSDSAACGSSVEIYCVNIRNPNYAGFNWVYGNQAGSQGAGQGANSGRNDNTAVGTFTENNYAAYMQDQLYLTDRLIFNGGVRYTYSNFSGTGTGVADYTAASPDLGLTYKFTQSFSVYANWAKGFMPQTQVTTSFIKPQYSEQKEVGFKMINNQYSLTASYFDLNQTNLATFSPGNPNNILFAGAVNVHGFEVDSSYRLPWVPELTLKLNYANLNSHVTNDGDPSNIGKVFPSIPTNQVGTWAQYDTKIRDHAVGFGVGSTWAGNRYADLQNSVVMPSYATVDVMSYFNVTQNIKLSAYVKNVGNVNYIAGGTSALGTMQGSPLVGMLALQIKY